MPDAAPQGLDLVQEARRQWQTHGWEGPDRGMAVVVSLMRAQQIVLGQLEKAVRPFGLSYARYEVLTLLSFSRTGQLPLNKIGARLQVHPASVTGVIDKLEQQGLVRRVPHPSDRRGVLAEITEEGRRVAEESTTALNAGPFGALPLSEQKAEDLIAILTDLRSAAGDLD